MTSPRPRIAQWPALVIVLAFLAIATIIWATGFHRGKGAFDQHYFHAKAIARFAIQLGAAPERFDDQLSPKERAAIAVAPGLDFTDYESATTPAYHVLLALIAKHLTSAELPLQIFASIFTIGLFWLFVRTLTSWAACREFPLVHAVLLALPLLCSTYVLLPGIWLQPDNAAWLGVLAMLLISLQIARSTDFARTLFLLVAGSLTLLALVWFRQSHAWTAGLLVAGCYLSISPRTDGPLAPLIRSPTRALVLIVWALIASLPAAMSVLYFFRLWDGPVPARFQTQIAGTANFATPAFCLSLIGVYAIFFAGWLYPAIVRFWRHTRLGVLAIIALALVVTIIPETTFVYEARASGLWNLVKVLDDRGLTIAGHTTPLFLVLAPLGAVALGAMTFSVRGSLRWMLLAAILGMIVAQTANPLCWQRYVEPLFLMVIPLFLLAGSTPHDDLDLAIPLARWTPALRILGPLALGLLLAAATAHALIRGQTLDWPRNSDAGTHFQRSDRTPAT